MPNGDKGQLFCVFDGHGGKDVADFAEKNFVSIFTGTSEFKQSKFDVALDADGDGMDDTWEVLNGLDPSDPDDWDDDPDGDGVWNIGEFRIGTDPWNPDSDDDDWTDGFEIAGGYDPLDPQWYLLRITQIAALPNFTVRYTGAAGVTYKVQSSFDLVVGTWADEPGSTVTPGTDGVVEFVDISPLAPEKFYRVVRVSP